MNKRAGNEASSSAAPEVEKLSLRDEVIKPLTDRFRLFLKKYPRINFLIALLVILTPFGQFLYEKSDVWLPWLQPISSNLDERHKSMDHIGKIAVIYPDPRMPSTLGLVGAEQLRGVNSGLNRLSQRSGEVIEYPLLIPFWTGISTDVRVICEYHVGSPHSYSLDCLDKVVEDLYRKFGYSVFVVFSSAASRKVIPITNIDNESIKRPRPIIILVDSSNLPINISERNVFRYFVNPSDEAERLAQYARESLILDFVGVFFAMRKGGLEDEYALTGLRAFTEEYGRVAGTQTKAFPVLLDGSDLHTAIEEFADLTSSFERPGAYVVGHGPMLIDSVRLLQERGFSGPILVSILGAEHDFNKNWPIRSNVFTVVPKTAEFDRRPLSLFASFSMQKSVTCSRWTTVDEFTECWRMTSDLDRKIGVGHQTNGDVTVGLDVFRIDKIFPRND